MLGLCDRFQAVPSQVVDEDVRVVRMVKVEALGREEVTGAG